MYSLGVIHEYKNGRKDGRIRCEQKCTNSEKFTRVLVNNH